MDKKIEDIIFYLMLVALTIIVPVLTILVIWFTLAPETFAQRYWTAAGIFVVQLAYWILLKKYLEFLVRGY